MPNFGLPLLLNWRLLRKTSYLKIKGLCGKVIYNLLITELDECKNRATLAANSTLPSNEPTTETRAATRPGERDKFRPGTVFDLHRGRKNIR